MANQRRLGRLAGRIILIALLLVAAFCAGMRVFQSQLPPSAQFASAERWIKLQVDKMRGREPVAESVDAFTNTAGRRQVACRSGGRNVAVILIIGQSQAGNFGQGARDPNDPRLTNLNYDDGKCYVARDPLLGNTGREGSMWSRMGAGLLATGTFDHIVLVPAAVGGTSIADWIPGGQYHSRLTRALDAARANGLTITHVLWQNGETDSQNGKLPQWYFARFGRLLESLRGLGVDAPVYATISTLCFDNGSILTRLQSELPRRFPGVRPGADLDSLDDVARLRRDGCHFSAAGLEQGARLWQAALVAPAGN